MTEKERKMLELCYRIIDLYSIKEQITLCKEYNTCIMYLVPSLN